MTDEFRFDCNRCSANMDAPGALVFGPPNPDDALVIKLHVCRSCWSDLFMRWFGYGLVAAKW